MEIKSIDMSIPSVVPEMNPTEKGGKEVQTAQVAAQNSPPLTDLEMTSFKAFFAVDENKNVVIRIADSKGNVIKQIPPPEYLEMAKTLSEVDKNLFHLEA